ncbi:MAG: hypothetical protein Q7O66_04110 [Dehalococcoidia bacterium]|nr:hypothetical protein [Dehalococcoidia bacterium]
MLEAVAKAIHRHWQAPLPIIIAAAVDELATRFFLRREPSTGLPSHAVRTLGAYYDDLIGSL